MATANAQRSRWNEMQSEREAAQAQRDRKLRALTYGASAGCAAVLLVAVGFALAGMGESAAHADTASNAPVQSALRVQTPPPPAPPPPPDIAIEGTIAQTWVKGSEYYGVQFDTHRSEKIELRFLGPHGLWADSDYKRWCSTRLDGPVRHCRYERKLDREVQAKTIPPGTWVLKACIGDACEELTRYEIALHDEPLHKPSKAEPDPQAAQTAAIDAPASPEDPGPALAENNG